MKKTSYTFRIIRTDINTDKIVFSFKSMHRNGRLKLAGKMYKDSFNDCEPYDRKTHVFYVSHSDIQKRKTAILYSKNYFFPFVMIRKTVNLENLSYVDCEQYKEEADNRLTFRKVIEEISSNGFSYTHRFYTNKISLPVHVFTIKADMSVYSIYVGTPEDGYSKRFKKATIPDMIASAERNGKNVIASINGDFFDIFGDMHPSGLLIKNGKLVTNGNSYRPFIGMTKDGKAVISDRVSNPELIKELDCACAGLQRIVKNGELYETAPIESFGYTTHPRSACGITKDGTVVLTVVDGRIPDYSNGASLYDLGKMMIAEGCVEAINIDGGGSSAVYIKEQNKLQLKSIPADQFRPNDKLIRKEADCIMLIKK